MKDAFFALGLVILALAVGVGIYMYSTQPARAPKVSESNARQVPFAELAQGVQSQEKRRVNYLIQSTSELTRLWDMIDAPGNAPVVDFSTDAVIAVFAGEQQTLGYSIAVTRIEDGDKRTVVVTLRSPGGSCILGQALSSPYAVVKVPKTSLPLIHETLAEVESCIR